MIRLLLIQNLTAAAPLATRLLAQVTANFFDELGVGSALLLMLVGMVLHWYAPRMRNSLEELMKDNKVTDAEAQRQIRFAHSCESVATVAGMVVLLAVLYDLTR
jgi:hypothetical protein